MNAQNSISTVSQFTKGFDTLLNKIEGISRVAVWVGGALLLAASLLIGVEVVLRKAFNISTKGADELSAYVLAISSSWAFAYALVKKAHIRVDALTSRFPLQIRAFLDALALLVLGIFGWLLSYRAFELVSRSFERQSTANTSLRTPLWIPQSLWFAGIVLFTVLCLLLFLRILWAGFVEKDATVITRLAGMPSIEEEVEEAKVEFDAINEAINEAISEATTSTVDKTEGNS